MVLLEERVKTIFLTLLILNTNFILIDLILKVFFPLLKILFGDSIAKYCW